MSNLIKLREMKLTDAKMLYPLTSNIECGKYMRHGAHQSLEQTQAMVEKYCRNENLAYIIEDETNQTIGFVALAKQDELNHSLTLMTFPEYWNKGYTSIAMQLVLEKTKESSKINTIISYVVKENIGSCRIMEKCHFELVNTIDDPKHQIVNVYKLNV